MNFKKVTGYDYVNLPKRQTEHSAGYDIESAETIEIKPMQTVLIKTGIKCEIPEGKWLGLYMRSSISLKRGLVMTNSVGVIDKDYYNNEDNEGHIHIMVTNLSDKVQTVKQGERIAQCILQSYYLSSNDNATGKRVGGFGSTSGIMREGYQNENNAQIVGSLYFGSDVEFRTVDDLIEFLESGDGYFIVNEN